MSSETGPAADPTLRRRIEPQEFGAFFDPQLLRKETCLLYEINWGGRHSVWRHTGQNTDRHAEINFIEKFTSERYFCPFTRCSITWFLSWSPCGECCRAIVEFLSRYPNVTLFIYVARLYHHTDERNRQGLRDLCRRGVTIRIMTEQECYYCWRNFVNYSPSNEAHWPRYPHLWVRMYVLELYCILLGLPPCLKILRRNQNQLTIFNLAFQHCHFQRLPYYIF
ncbi:C-_U-editing enzyme APOBEC-1 isoform X2 [Meriones unguiculatus]|uniref:C->U-editing enzyme APOBEC-1 isoform X2 n=1 Tax=Meriones unguiculatus TaxID=10047 RepID=UPI000B4E9C95|nr:C->U-editing enzyme APOBEC-1 isoform X2 [Meriones unguiculatus]